MSNTEKDKEFYEMADAYIALANKQSKNTEQGKVSATFLYAAARFNIFLVATGATSADDFAAKKKIYWTISWRNTKKCWKSISLITRGILTGI